MKRRLAAACLAGVALAAAPARGDGGVACGSGGAPPLRLHVLVAPTPLRVGPAEISVYLQTEDDVPGGPPPRVRLRVSRPDFCEPTRELEAVAGGSGGALPGARVIFELPGPVVIDAEAAAGAAVARATCRLEVAPAGSPLRAHWPLLALPPAAVALYAANRTLAARAAERRRGLSAPRPRW